MVLKSKTLLSSLVSWFTRIFSDSSSCKGQLISLLQISLLRPLLLVFPGDWHPQFAGEVGGKPLRLPKFPPLPTPPHFDYTRRHWTELGLLWRAHQWCSLWKCCKKPLNSWGFPEKNTHLLANFTMAFETASETLTRTCTENSRCLSTMKHCLPLARLVCRRPLIQTWCPVRALVKSFALVNARLGAEGSDLIKGNVP